MSNRIIAADVTASLVSETDGVSWGGGMDQAMGNLDAFDFAYVTTFLENWPMGQTDPEQQQTGGYWTVTMKGGMVNSGISMLAERQEFERRAKHKMPKIRITVVGFLN